MASPQLIAALRDVANIMGGPKGRDFAEAITKVVLETLKAAGEGVLPGPLGRMLDGLAEKGITEVLALEDKELQKLQDPPPAPDIIVPTEAPQTFTNPDGTHMTVQIEGPAPAAPESK